jgi:2-polyprenyl-3-methyl-5-hydroxy-6-metoxy-1,4-benzoquinol methylase
MTTPSTAHWEHIYASKPTDSDSWFQEHAHLSLQLIRDTAVAHTAAIIDVGGGASTLVDDLLRDGFSAITVLDLSSSALEAAKSRLGALADSVTWVTADITTATLQSQAYDVWHDRAVFHFLTSEDDRQRYVATVSSPVAL